MRRRILDFEPFAHLLFISGSLRLRAAARLSGAQAVRVLWGSYSVVQARAHLHAHCGVTNAQLKMHLGLDVPVNPHTGLGCARIANETRRWEAGRVLVFDDSFEHEVWNDCEGGDEATRSVFQLVFAHPDLGQLIAGGLVKDPFDGLGLEAFATAAAEGFGSKGEGPRAEL